MKNCKHKNIKTKRGQKTGKRGGYWMIKTCQDCGKLVYSLDMTYSSTGKPVITEVKA